MVILRATYATSILALAMLSGCQQLGRLPSESAALPEQPQGVEGNWIGTDGVAVSSLYDGKFQSRSAKTGEKLTDGTYTHEDARTIKLSFFSVKSRRQAAATCLLVDINQMNCTLASGARFVLGRHHA